MNQGLSIGIISLGCDKNRVDTERMMFILSNAGFTITAEVEVADIIVVNTCAFIEAARKEAIELALALSEHKKERCKKLIMTGCLPKKHPQELFDEMSEVDAFLGTGDYNALPSIINQLLESNERIIYIKDEDGESLIRRVQSTPNHYAYLKIAEGCFNACSFCTIPQIRGKYRSYAAQRLLQEAKELADNGCRELILVAQDTGGYGLDRGESDALAGLIESLCDIDGIEWIRLLYCYPERITPRLLNVLAHNPKVAKYIDIPMQHAHNDILKSMRRASTQQSLQELIYRIREANEKIAIRSTFIVGYPTEEESHFEALLEFLNEQRLNNMGFFAYSREKGTAAYSLKPQVGARVKRERLRRAQALAMHIMMQNQDKLIGQTLKVLYEDIDYSKGMFLGRSEFCAPDIDSRILFKGSFADVGKFYNVQITRRKGLDLIGKIKE